MVNLILFGLKFLFLFLFYVLVVVIARGIFADSSPDYETAEEEPEVRLYLMNELGNVIKETGFKNDAVIGRSPKSELQIEDETSSYTHAKVFKQGNNYFVQDLESTNGTYLNSAKIKKARLTDGDIIAIGKQKIKFVK